jgi:hypothetical protein
MQQFCTATLWFLHMRLGLALMLRQAQGQLLKNHFALLPTYSDFAR